MEVVRVAWETLLGGSVPTGAFAVLVTLETLFPRPGSPAPSLRSRLKAVQFWIVYWLVSALVLRGLSPLYFSLGVRPLFDSLAPGLLPRPAALVVAAILGALIGDFFYYWCHRAEHRFLWRFHAVHHAVREMSGVTAYHHVTEPLMKTVLYVLPVSLFIRDPFTAPVIGALLGLQGHYLHSMTRLNFGPLGRLIQDNRFHRIHHSIHAEHHDKNFAVFTTVWDRLFGTAYFPAKDEWPETGVADMPEPETVLDYLWAPFATAGPPAPARRAPEAG
jgi:sterol desaturase/sphingolipid hydroxylase (fatty acid hydroxylase superfamily)